MAKYRLMCVHTERERERGGGREEEEEEERERERERELYNVYNFIDSCISKTTNILTNMLELHFRTC